MHLTIQVKLTGCKRIMLKDEHACAGRTRLITPTKERPRYHEAAFDAHVTLARLSDEPERRAAQDAIRAAIVAGHKLTA